jgi:phosphatidylglycerophosphate synthase
LLDGAARRLIGPAIDRLGAAAAGVGLSADAITLVGFALGLVAAGLVAAELYILALALILLSRLCDGLDGAVARRTRKTDRGGYLDIVLDFAFYGAIPLGFALANPAANALAAATLLASFYVNGASFLAFAAMAEKRRLPPDSGAAARGEKSLHFTTGLAEATETILAFSLFCLFPAAFPPLAYAFAAFCLVTAAARIVLAARVFRLPP